ncbi:hypothetical protein [Vulcaniibacterium tengchongense]|uniref:Inhibitor of lysozyme (Ivy) n=1 Tax=Vulcaniibacterium tengchongense TaxID=1273429 RepID=A0A3N4V851_9GAMM|nr:hypothetical protein [Vulcaniibacterium tengchongense]RPE75881.1 hypothetical protein EDC50_2778 [Vulcaniibacterium tengchongense]
MKTTFWREAMAMTMRNARTWLALAVFLVVNPGCSKAQQGTQRVDALEQAAATHATWRKAEAPASLNRYVAEPFNLLSREPSLVTGKVHHDAVFQKAWEQLLRESTTTPQTLEKRLLSGPATEGAYWESNDRHGFLYMMCQIHACSTTNLVLFFQPETASMGGRLQERCQVRWVGEISDDIKRLIEDTKPIDLADPNREFDCAEQGDAP